MNKLITICLLIMGLVVTGCGSSASPANEPVVIGVVSDSTTPGSGISIADYTGEPDANGNIHITISGANFGNYESEKAVFYNGYTDQNSTLVQRVPLSFDNGGSWTDNLINVLLYKATYEQFPYGYLSIRIRDQEYKASNMINFGNRSLKNARVDSVTPSILYSYDTNNMVTLTGSGFGKERKNLTLQSTYYDALGSCSPTIIEWSDTRITFLVPADFVSKSSNILIKDAENNIPIGNSSSASFMYVPFNPSIDYISPSQAYPGQTVTIYSNSGFGDTKPNNLLLFVNDQIVNSISSWSNNSVSFVIPNSSSLVAGKATIRMQSNNKSVENNSLVLVPNITSVTVNGGGLFNDYTYTITGICLRGSNLNISNSPTIKNIRYSYSGSSEQVIFECNSNLAGYYLYMMVEGTTIYSNSVTLP